MPENTTYETIHLYIKGDADLISSLIEAALQQELQVTRPIGMRGEPILTTVIATLGSAGVFTTLIQIITRLLQHNKDKELIIERKGAKIALKGHSLPEEKEIISCLAPELLQAINKPHERVQKNMPDSK